MISERDIYITAQILVDRYGAYAVDEAQVKQREMQRQSDEAGMLVWKRVERAVDILQATEMPSVTH